MRITPSRALVSSIMVVLSACASAQEPGGTAATTADATGYASPSELGTATSTADQTQPTASPTAAITASTTTTTTSTATAASIPEGPVKDPNALIIEPAFITKGGGKVAPETVAELMKSFDTRLAASSKMAGVGAKGVSTARHVVATFLLEPAVTDDKGLTVKMGFTGVESVGKCPIFDLDQRLTMSGGKNTPADVLELQKAAVTALLEKLEQSAPTLKPKANCTASKPK